MATSTAPESFPPCSPLGEQRGNTPSMRNERLVPMFPRDHYARAYRNRGTKILALYGNRGEQGGTGEQKAQRGRNYQTVGGLIPHQVAGGETVSLVNGIHFSWLWHGDCGVWRAMARLLPRLALLAALPACTLDAAPSSPEDAPGEAMAADTWCDCDGLPVAPCSRPACDGNGVCYLDHTLDGEAADVDQPHGDCLTAVCIGLAVVQAYEPHDRPTLPDACVTSVCTPTGPVWTERDGCLP